MRHSPLFHLDDIRVSIFTEVRTTIVVVVAVELNSMLLLLTSVKNSKTLKTSLQCFLDLTILFASDFISSAFDLSNICLVFLVFIVTTIKNHCTGTYCLLLFFNMWIVLVGKVVAFAHCSFNGFNIYCYLCRLKAKNNSIKPRLEFVLI